MTSENFADRLVKRVRAHGHPLCAGLDAYLDKIPPLFRQGTMEANDPETATAVENFFKAYLDRLEGKVPVVKPQSSLFEQLGWRGARALENIIRYARERGHLVLLDAKRGDIGATAEGYASAYLNPSNPMCCDAVTVNPYLGLDTMEPFAEKAEEFGAGYFVLVKTSNPGSGIYQDQALATGPFFKHVAVSLNEMSQKLRGPETGWSSLGVVVGATYPEQAYEVRDALPNAIFLIPGYGAQGGGADDAVRGFVGSEGGIVNSSRGILYPDGSYTDDVATWEQAIDDAVKSASEDLAAAVAKRN